MAKRKVNKTVKRARSGKAVIKNAQDAVPFLEWFENKLFRVTENTYSLICSFDNAGYLSKPDNEKEIFRGFSVFDPKDFCAEKFFRGFNKVSADGIYRRTDIVFMAAGFSFRTGAAFAFCAMSAVKSE